MCILSDQTCTNHVFRLLLFVIEGEREWDHIIPEEMRSKVEEEERMQQLLELQLPPRSRKTIKQVKSSSSLALEQNNLIVIKPCY